MRRQQVVCVSWGQGCFRKNLHISGTESKLFFLQGVNRNTPKLQGGKNVLTQIFIRKSLILLLGVLGSVTYLVNFN